MMSKELYRTTFRKMQPSQEAVQRLMCVPEGLRQNRIRKRNPGKLRLAIVFAVLFIGAAGCGYAIKSHVAMIQTHNHMYYGALEQYEQAVADYPDEELLQVSLPEKLGYGYVFENCIFMEQSLKDNEDRKQERKMLDVTYMISGNMADYKYWRQPEMHLNVGELFDYQKENMEQATPTASMQIGDVEVCYLEGPKVYMVAPDYEFTERDLQVIQEEKCMILTGLEEGQKPRFRTHTTCYWILDDKFYELTQYDSQLADEDWFEVAKVIIEAQ